jgi:hypothetical protein
VIKPKIVHDLEIANGSSYGYEEAIALLEVLQDMAPSCGKKVKQFETSLLRIAGQNTPWQSPQPPPG